MHSKTKNLLTKAGFHMNKEEYDIALSLYKEVIVNDEANFTANLNIGAILAAQNKLLPSYSQYEITLKFYPNVANLHFNLGVISQKLNKHWQALDHFLKAIHIKPDYIEAFENLANTQYQLGFYNDAIKSYNFILKIQPNRDSTLYSLSLILLLHGYFKQGWELYEHRWATKEFGNKGVNEIKRTWTNKHEMAGKKLLLIREQGFGDTIQFSRFAIVLSNLNLKVTLVVQPELVNLIRTLNNIGPLNNINVISHEEINEDIEYDYYLPMMSIPNALNGIYDDIPVFPQYLWANDEKISYWEGLISKNGMMNIGVAWTGSPNHNNDSNRSIPFRDFKKIFNRSANYHKLNNEIRTDEIEEVSRTKNLHIWDHELKTFEDTAALIFCMDLIITVDTSIVHLAGSMNKKTHLLLPRSPDFRWLLEKNESTWYSSVRLFRSPIICDWSSLIELYNNNLI